MPNAKRNVLILCTGNSARSQMAEGLLRAMVDADEWNVFSAGTKPSAVRPEAIKVMKEIDIDISAHRSKSADEFAEKPIDIVLTVCDNARETCPYFPAAVRTIHHSFDDPAESAGVASERLEAFRKVRNEILEYLRAEFLDVLDKNKRGAV